MAKRGTAPAAEELERLQQRLMELREKLVSWEAKLAPSGKPYPARRFASARNLAHYLALRSEDLRPLQGRLAACGLSSLGRSESHVLGSLDAVLALLNGTNEKEVPIRELPQHLPLSVEDGREILEARAAVLFGPPPETRSVRIMVTAPEEAARDYSLVRDLLAKGVDCLRINCAHGDRESWIRMVDNVRHAERELGRSCKILMDLPGPRTRTGAIETGPRVTKVGPRRDTLGWVTRPAEVWLTSTEQPAPPPWDADAALTLPPAFLAELVPGDRLRFRDSRDARRALVIVSRAGTGCRARIEKTAYIADGTIVRLKPAAGRKVASRKAMLGGVPPVEQRIRLAEGDRLILTSSQEPGRPALLQPDGGVVEVARVPCTPPEVLRDVRIGEPIWFDEGRIGGRIASIDEDQVTVTVTSAAPNGSNLGPEKGINLPESDLRLPSLTAQDVAILPFIAEHADLVGFSFLRAPEDVAELHRRLDELPGANPGVILKIETVRAFQELPAILFEALRHPAVGVMIARGDLAVECGFERLAEVQEEILWLCEAAHLPVIWATQVLEGLAKRGLASRAEITDAAVGERAECVMLNKGPFIVETVRALDGILSRMQHHQEKKQQLLRHLNVADALFERMAGGGRA